jgi:Fe(3+) dicitrate transport protein
MRGIEVVKGSGSVLFGPSTIGGVINFLTLNPPSRESASVAADYGSYAYRRVLGQYGNAFGSARYLVQADYKGGDGPRADGFTSIDTFGKVAIDTSKTGTLTLKLSFHDDLSIAEDVGLTRDMFTSDPRAPVLDPHDQMHQRRYAASAIYEQPLGETTTLRALAYAYETQRTWRRQHFQRTTPGGAPPGSFERFVGTFAEPGEGLWFLNSDAILDRTYDVAGVEPRFETKLRTGPVEHDFSYGARVLGETARYSVLAGGTFDSDTGADQNEERHRSVGVAAYVDDAIAFRDDLVVTPGLRYEHVDSHRIVLRTTGTTTADVNQPGDLSSGSFIPGIGMVLGARDHHVFGGLFYGWQPPRVASSFSPKGTPLPVSPQTAINYEIGARVSPAKWARTEVTGFLISYENEVVSGAGSSAELTNGGPTRHVGGEGSAVVQIGRALEWKTALDLIARYNYARATFVGGPNAGNFVPYAPLSTFNAVADVQHPSGFGAEVAFYYFGWQYADATNIYAQDATGQYGLIPAHTNLDANARYKWEKTGLTFRLAVKNALDQVYVSERRPQGIAVGGFREVLAGVRWDWDAGPPREEK